VPHNPSAPPPAALSLRRLQLIQTGDEVGSDVGAIDCRERLGGMLKYYYRKAA